MLAVALKEAAAIELDPTEASFEAAAAKAVAEIHQESGLREAFYRSLDKQWDREEAAHPVKYPENPGPLILAAQRPYEDDLDHIEPTGWTGGTDKRGTVMIVDDSPAYRTSLKSQLEGEGYEVILAVDGWDALGHSLADVDMLVVDIMMPRMTGIELVDIIHHRDGFKDIPVIMITSDEVHRWEGRAAAVGASLLSKPVKMDLLLDQIRVGLQTTTT